MRTSSRSSPRIQMASSPSSTRRGAVTAQLALFEEVAEKLLKKKIADLPIPCVKVRRVPDYQSPARSTDGWLPLLYVVVAG